LPAVLADRDKLKTVLEKLADNAVTYTKNRGKISEYALTKKSVNDRFF